MRAKLLRLLGWVAYAVAVFAVFVVTAYFSFSGFVRRGVTAVPEIAGLPRNEAEAKLTDQGLALILKEEARFSDAVPAGHILQQRRRPGSLVKRGTGVEAVLSLGPELIDVPDLGGAALQAAQVTLAAVGLSVGRTLSVFSGSGPAGTVVEQDPAAGKQVGRAAQVELFISLEERSGTFVMPDLVYRDYEAVRRFFERRQLRLGSVKFETYEGISPGIILRQFPLAGHQLKRQDVISLVVTTQERLGA